MLAYKKILNIAEKKFVTKFVTRITKFVTCVSKFVTCITKFVIKNILYESKKYLPENEKYQGDNEKFPRRQYFLSRVKKHGRGIYAIPRPCECVLSTLSQA